MSYDPKVKKTDEYWKGFRAFQEGKQSRHNPYSRDRSTVCDEEFTPRYCWFMGYYDARHISLGWFSTPKKKTA